MRRQSECCCRHKRVTREQVEPCIQADDVVAWYYPAATSTGNMMMLVRGTRIPQLQFKVGKQCPLVIRLSTSRMI